MPVCPFNVRSVLPLQIYFYINFQSVYFLLLNLLAKICMFCFRYIWGGLLVIAGVYLNIYGKKNKGTAFLVSLQQLYMALQRRLGPKVSTVREGDTSLFNV